MGWLAQLSFRCNEHFAFAINWAPNPLGIKTARLESFTNIATNAIRNQRPVIGKQSMHPLKEIA